MRDDYGNMSRGEAVERCLYLESWIAELERGAAGLIDALEAIEDNATEMGRSWAKLVARRTLAVHGKEVRRIDEALDKLEGAGP